MCLQAQHSAPSPLEWILLTPAALPLLLLDNILLDSKKRTKKRKERNTKKKRKERKRKEKKRKEKKKKKKTEKGKRRPLTWTSAAGYRKEINKEQYKEFGPCASKVGEGIEQR